MTSNLNTKDDCKGRTPTLKIEFPHLFRYFNIHSAIVIFQSEIYALTLHIMLCVVVLQNYLLNLTRVARTKYMVNIFSQCELYNFGVYKV